jgi:hypothetical protein
MTRKLRRGPVIALWCFFYMKLTHTVWGVEAGVFFALINRN